MGDSRSDEPGLTVTIWDCSKSWYMESTFIEKIFGEIGIVVSRSVSEGGCATFSHLAPKPETLKIHISATKKDREV